MILPLAQTTLRECLRRPFPYVAATALVLLALASGLFLGFSFGSGEAEARNIAVSAVFLAGLALAGLVGTGLVRRDLERGTLGLLLSKPLGLGRYLVGRYVGLALASSAVAALAALGATAVLALLPEGGGPPDAQVLAAWLRALLLVAVLDAAALAASAAVPRAAAAPALFAVFLGGSVVEKGPVALFLPDFSLFALEVEARPSWLALLLYAVLFSAIFLLLAYLVLFRRPVLQQRG